MDEADAAAEYDHAGCSTGSCRITWRDRTLSHSDGSDLCRSTGANAAAGLQTPEAGPADAFQEVPCVMEEPAAHCNPSSVRHIRICKQTAAHVQFA